MIFVQWHLGFVWLLLSHPVSVYLFSGTLASSLKITLQLVVVLTHTMATSQAVKIILITRMLEQGLVM